MNKNQIKDLMKKTNFTIDGRSGINACFLFILALGLWIMPGQTHGQGGNCSLACNSMTQISLDEDCDTEVTWDMILNASNTSCPGGEFVVTVSKKHGLPIPTSPIVNKAHIGQTLVAEVRDLNSGNRCWGEILIEDKLPPFIDCRNDTLYCYEMRNYAGPLATDNCQKAALLHANESYPWGGGPLYDDYTTSMDAVFGEGTWDDFIYGDFDPEIIFSKAYCYIYMEGSDFDANEMNAFLIANRTLIEQWVADGGRLFLNAAPNEGGNINFGFGNPAQGIPNVTLLFDNATTFRSASYAPDDSHPVIQGPFQPTGDQFTGNYFGHALVCPPGMNNILEATADSAALLIEAAFGDGYVLFGGMTASGWHGPQPQARNLKWNILEYLKNLGGPDVTLTLLNEVITPIECDEEFIKRVTRTYTATDAQGNQSPNCTYEILLRRFPHEDVVCPDDFSIEDENALQCDDVFQLDANGNPHPSVTGVPTVGGIPLWPNQDFYCNINVSYEDLDLPKIGCVEKVMRLWTIREWWCSEEITTTCAQLIEIVDEEGPVVIAPRDMTVTTAGGYTCEAVVDLPPAIVEDACSQTTTVDVQYPGGFLKNQNGGRVRLPLGENEIIYIGYDECYNSTRDVMIVNVVDKTAPVAVCDKHTVVGLTYDGFAHVYAETFDDGSYDDCWIDSMAVKRMDDGEGCGIIEDEFGPYVTFCCEDIANNDIMVRFRVYDESGNYGECMVEVTVQDKIPPHITCPPNLTINCDFHLDRNDLSVLGNVVEDKSLQEPIGITPPYLLDWDGPLYDGLAHDNCDLTIREDAQFDVNQCNIGTIVRTFYASDPNGTVTCTQTIEIINDDPFYINPFDPQDTLDDIVWPLDYETFESCDIVSLHPDSLPAGFGRPDISEDKCDLVGATWKDHVFPFAGNQACFKIIRKWKVIDWCQFENGRYYQWEYEQIIKVNNDVAPVITTDCGPKSVCTFDPQCIDGEIELIAMAEDDCTPDEDLMWTFEIDEFNDGIFDVKVSGTGNTIDASGPYPVGEHRIKYSFEDRCGNKTFCIQEFEIVNCKAPLAYCQNGIVVTLMPVDTDGDGQVDDGMVEIWAEDFDAGSSHPCGYELTFSFDEDGTELARIYNCDSIANGNRLDVKIYITDENGNQSSCNNFIIIQDNSNACTNTITSAVIAGRIATEENEHVSEVNVKLEGAGNVNFMTKNDGAYAFPPMPYGGQYTVIPARNDDYMNGVSTADLVAIQRHLLGLKNLDSPYKLIAADANASGDITARDIVELRKLILGLNTELPGNTSWKFVDKGYVFPDPTNPFSVQWPEAYPINGLNTNMMNVDFIAVKVGDVNSTVKPNELIGTTVRSLAGTLQLEVDALQYTAGQQLEVPVYASNFDGITGYQFTLHFDNNQFSFNAIEAGQIEVSEANFGLNRTQDGVITTSWNGLETEVNADEPLFTLVFNALQSGSLMDELYISSAITAAEAYTVQNEAYNVNLRYRSSDAKGTFALYQNTPNPFSDETTIRFNLPEAGEAALTIYDVNGKIIRRYEINGTQGMNEQRILSGSLEASGILYYQLDTKNHTATKRMVVLK